MPTRPRTQSESLVRRLGPDSGPCIELVGAIQAQLATRTGTAAMTRWERFWRVNGVDPDGKGGPPGEALSSIFARQTYLHLVLALIATRYRDAWAGRPEPGRLRDILGGAGFGERLDRVLRARTLPGVRELLEPTLFAWLAEAPGRAVTRAVRSLAGTLDERAWEPLPATEDLFGPLYLSLTPRSRLRALGEFYTPAWLVDLVLERVGFSGRGPDTLLDPTCGSGAFLAGAVAQTQRAGGSALEKVLGIELNPLAVSMSRLRFLIALGPAGRAAAGADPIRIPVRWGDVLRGPIGESLAPSGSWQDFRRVAFLAGNPPWVNWEKLSPAARAALKALEGGYAESLFPHRGLVARGGGAHDDLAGLITYVAVDRFLAPRGRLGLVVPLSLFKSVRGGEGFRRFGLPGRLAFRVAGVDDLTRLKPFPTATGKAAVLVADRDASTRYPLPYRVWAPRGRSRLRRAGLAEVRKRCDVSEWVATPVDPGAPASPWLTAPPALLDPLRSVAGPSAHRARKGVDTSLNAVFWVRALGRRAGLVRIRNAQTRSRAPVESREALVEPAALYPLLRGRDFGRWRYDLPLHQVLLYDPERGRPLPLEVAAERYPRALDYLSGYEPRLRERRIYRVHLSRQPFYACYDIGPYSFAPYKVVWKALANGIRAAVVGPQQGLPVLPDHNVVLVPFAQVEAAHFLCGVLNSRLCTCFADAYTGWFYSVHLLRNFRAPGYDPSTPLHREISRLSQRAHGEPDEREALQERLERRVRALDGFAKWRGLQWPGESQ